MNENAYSTIDLSAHHSAQVGIKMINLIIYSLLNFFRIYLISKFIHIFTGDIKQNRVKEILAYGFFFLINTGLYLIFHHVWINLFSNLIGISLMVLLYTKSIKTNIFVTSSIYLINMGCDTITVLVTNYDDGQKENQIYSIITVFFIFICEILAEKIINHRKKTDTVQNLPLIVVPLSSLAMIIFLTDRKSRPDMELAIVSLGLLFINFLVLYLYNLLSKSFTQKYENEILRQKVQIYSNQIDVILQSEEEVKTLRHDMKHHMNELKLLAMKDDSAAIQEYIDNMEAYIHNPNEIVSSGNMQIDSVLNYMLQRGKRELLTVHTNIQLPQAVSHSFDINIILGNLLENAIEAARQTEEKLLNVSIQLRQGVLKIEIENSFNSMYLVLENQKEGGYRPITTKKEKKHHGIGLNSVRKIVEKYNGIMEACPQNNRFCVKLLLYMPKIED